MPAVCFGCKCAFVANAIRHVLLSPLYNQVCSYLWLTNRSRWHQCPCDHSQCQAYALCTYVCDTLQLAMSQPNGLKKVTGLRAKAMHCPGFHRNIGLDNTNKGAMRPFMRYPQMFVTTLCAKPCLVCR